VATTLYASLATFKDELDIDPNNVLLDSKITRALTGSSRGIDRVTGRQRFWVDDNVSQRDLSMDNRVTSTQTGEQLLLLNGWDIATNAGLLVSVGSVGGTFTPLTTFSLYPDEALVDGWPIEGLVQPTGIWNRLPGFRVRVTAKWGWAAVPDDIQQACLILARRLYNRKDSPSGVMGSADWVVNLAKRDPDVVTLLERFCLPGFG
jgi:hypothetical protein